MTRLAYASPDYLRVILDEGAFKVALEIARITNRGHLLLDELAKFMAVVCRGKLLPNEVICFARPLLYLYVPHKTIFNKSMLFLIILFRNVWLLPFWTRYYKGGGPLTSIYREHALHFHIFLMEGMWGLNKKPVKC